VVNSIR